MPQMAPMEWLMMYFLFTIMFLILINKIYFIFISTKTNKSKSFFMTTPKSITWTW